MHVDEHSLYNKENNYTQKRVVFCGFLQKRVAGSQQDIFNES